MSSTDERDVDAAIAALARLVVGRESVEESLQRIAELARAHVEGADSVSVTVIGADGTPRTAACTDDTSLTIDRAQYEGRRGPCLEAYERQQVVRVDSTLDVSRWPEFETVAVEQDVRASLSVPLVVDAAGVGAVNIYSRAERPWTPASEATATSLAAQGAVAVANAMLYLEATEMAEHLERALQTRDVIGQAKGILMERHRIDADEAFDRLREMSQRENVKLREVAERIASATG